MPQIFVNYRTDDEEATATLVDRELSRVFGNENVFKASKSIGPGSRFPQELLTAVRRSSVLLAVIGPRWLKTGGAGDGAPWRTRATGRDGRFRRPLRPVPWLSLFWSAERSGYSTRNFQRRSMISPTVSTAG